MPGSLRGINQPGSQATCGKKYCITGIRWFMEGISIWYYLLRYSNREYTQLQSPL